MIRVHSYESLGTYDGPGIRLVVFLQGCNFRCLYCANPDTIDAVGKSKLTAPEEIIRMAVNQRPFFGKKGGVTFSGGEPTFQAKELIPIVKELQAEGIHVCIDTNGGIWNKYVEELMSIVDLVLLDVKHLNGEKHRALTMRGNEQTLKTAQWLEAHQKPFWLRYVVVPGYSNDKEDIKALGEYFKDYKMLERLEILPYHTLGEHKYEAMHQEYQLKGVRLNTEEELEEIATSLRNYISTVYVN